MVVKRVQSSTSNCGIKKISFGSIYASRGFKKKMKKELRNGAVFHCSITGEKIKASDKIDFHHPTLTVKRMKKFLEDLPFGVKKGVFDTMSYLLLPAKRKANRALKDVNLNDKRYLTNVERSSDEMKEFRKRNNITNINRKVDKNVGKAIRNRAKKILKSTQNLIVQLRLFD